MRFARCLAFFCLCLNLTACITPSEKKQMKDDLFNVQTRVLNLERLLTDTSKEGKSNAEAAVRRIASTQAELERMSRELQQVHGDIDALKVGVSTGEMPGLDPGPATKLARRQGRGAERKARDDRAVARRAGRSFEESRPRQGQEEG